VSPRLPARAFYGIILAGVLLGAFAAGGAAWAYLAFGADRPDARQIWGDVADTFVVPVAVMVGATFGGLIGVGAAVLLSVRIHSREVHSK
jgi:hypothetical protein